MRTSFRKGAPQETSADTLCVGLFENEEAPKALDDALKGELGRLIESGEANGSFKKTAVLHPNGTIAAARVISVGLGKRDEFDPERARIAAAVALARANDSGAKSIGWALPDGTDAGRRPSPSSRERCSPTIASTGTRAKTQTGTRSGASRSWWWSPSEELGDPVAQAALVAEAQNDARDLQNLPANALTPTKLAEHAELRASEIDGLQVETFGPDEIAELKMGGLRAVAQGSDEEPRLIVMRYQGGGSGLLGIVGKAVTFDTGGISIKPAAKMHEMKFDKSGGCVAIEATAAIARLGLPVNVLTVVPATENMPSGHAIKPGDIITISNGKTVEVNNTDAEGRLILADALAYAVASGADRIVDLATLTGAIIVALGSTYAGLFSNDDQLAEEIEQIGGQTGELCWRLPLHPGLQGVDARQGCRPRERLGGTQGIVGIRSVVPRGVRRRDALGAPRHRRHGLGPGQP